MKGKNKDVVAEKVDKVIELLQQLVVLELSRRGATQEAIGKNVRLAKSSVVKMLSGIGRDSLNE